jgi:hypothetical protein
LESLNLPSERFDILRRDWFRAQRGSFLGLGLPGDHPLAQKGNFDQLLLFPSIIADGQRFPDRDLLDGRDDILSPEDHVAVDL